MYLRRGSPVKGGSGGVDGLAVNAVAGIGGSIPGAAAFRRRLPIGGLLVALLVIFTAHHLLHSHASHHRVHEDIRQRARSEFYPESESRGSGSQAVVDSSVKGWVGGDGLMPERKLPGEEPTEKQGEVLLAGDGLNPAAEQGEDANEEGADGSREESGDGEGVAHGEVDGSLEGREGGEGGDGELGKAGGAMEQAADGGEGAAEVAAAHSRHRNRARRREREVAQRVIPVPAAKPVSAQPIRLQEGQSIEEALEAMDAALDGKGFNEAKFTRIDPPPLRKPEKVGESQRKKVVAAFFNRMKDEAFALIRSDGEDEGGAAEGGPAAGEADVSDSGLPLEDSLPRGHAAEDDTAIAVPRIGTPAEDDVVRPCRLSCHPHGFCQGGRCVCVAAWTGVICNEPRMLPMVDGDFEGAFIANQRSLIAAGGMNMTTNPKASDAIGHGRTHSLIAPYEPAFPHPEKLLRKTGESVFRQRPVITSAHLKLFPETDILSRAVYNSCALVGSSGLNLMYRDGAEIDAHDAVFRFNSAPTRGKDGDYTAHVGRKTAFRFINTQHITFDEGGEWRLQQMQSKNALLRYSRMKHDDPDLHLVALDPAFTAYVNANIATLPTGGYFALMFALQKCRTIRIYGFHWQQGHGVPHHYFNTEKPLAGTEQLHDYAAEHERLDALADAGVVEVAQPCLRGCQDETGVPCQKCAPGSACACGGGHPLPLALPGFCHLPRALHCFYACPGGAAQCPGGPGGSACPRGFSPLKENATCASREDVPHALLDYSSGSSPSWIWDPSVGEADSARGSVREGGGSARSCATFACRMERMKARARANFKGIRPGRSAGSTGKRARPAAGGLPEVVMQVGEAVQEGGEVAGLEGDSGAKP